jgi:hypothetical protein
LRLARPLQPNPPLWHDPRRGAASIVAALAFPGESMKFELSLRAAVVGFVAALAASGAVQAQQNWRPFASITPVYLGNADLDGGGDYSVFSTVVRAGVQGSLGGANLAGVTFNYDYSDYSFSNPAAFGGVAPWNVVKRYGVAVPLMFGVSDGWMLGVIPSADWIRENGADESESLNWGGIFSATRFFGDGNRLGLGVGVFQRLEKTSVFPLLLVDWKLGDRWRLVNPLSAGPTGPAGLELDYRLDGGWNLGLGAAWRTTRFRLSESGPVPNGIGEERGMPVFLRATRNFGQGLTMNLYAGVVTAGQLRVEDPSGRQLREVDVDPAPLLAVTFSARF